MNTVLIKVCAFSLITSTDLHNYYVYNYVCIFVFLNSHNLSFVLVELYESNFLIFWKLMKNSIRGMFNSKISKQAKYWHFHPLIVHGFLVEKGLEFYYIIWKSSL